MKPAPRCRSPLLRRSRTMMLLLLSGAIGSEPGLQGSSLSSPLSYR